MLCNALFYEAARPSIKKHLLALLRVSLIQPIQWIHLDAVYPDLPMQVRTCGPAGSSNNADDLTLFHHITYINKDLRLMPETTVYSPTVIDEGRIPAHS